MDCEAPRDCPAGEDCQLTRRFDAESKFNYNYWLQAAYLAPIAQRIEREPSKL